MDEAAQGNPNDEERINKFLVNLFCRPHMWGVRTPHEFLQMLVMLAFFHHGPRDPDFFRRWEECLPDQLPRDDLTRWIERIQDDWFVAAGLPPDDPNLVQPVLKHRAYWAGKEPPKFIHPEERPVEIKINVHVDPVATCTECSARMARHSDPESGLIFFWCPICDEGGFFPELNILARVSKGLFDPEYRLRTWKVKAEELDVELPEFDFGGGDGAPGTPDS